MGYYTTFNLRANPELTTEMSLYIKVNAGQLYAIDHYGGSTGETKWYEHEADMIQMSKQFPRTLFVLSGEGEENGDQWLKYFIGGKLVKSVKAEITFEHVDEQELLNLHG